MLASGLESETVGMRSPTSYSRIAEGITKRQAAKRSGKHLTIGSGTIRIVQFFSLRFVWLWSRPESEPSPSQAAWSTCGTPESARDIVDGRQCCAVRAPSRGGGGTSVVSAPGKKRDLVRRSMGHCMCPLTKRKESCAAAVSKPPSPDSTAFGSLFTTCFSLLPGRRKQQPPRGWWRVVACHLVCGVHNFLNCCLCFFVFFRLGFLFIREGGRRRPLCALPPPPPVHLAPPPHSGGKVGVCRGCTYSASKVRVAPVSSLCTSLPTSLSHLRIPPPHPGFFSRPPLPRSAAPSAPLLFPFCYVLVKREKKSAVVSAYMHLSFHLSSHCNGSSGVLRRFREGRPSRFCFG